MKTIENIFKVGDRVYLYPLGWGDIQCKSDYDYSIYFEGIEDTRYIGGDVRRLLSFTEYTLEGLSQERPEELPKQGDIVWVRDYEREDWIIRMFVKKHITDNKSDFFYVAVEDSPFSNDIAEGFDYWREMTTTNPYANEHTKEDEKEMVGNQ